MSGILDSKTRVIDTVITQEGKRQISTGGLRAVYATVSDRHSYYEKDAEEGSTDATKRIYFEPPGENLNDSIIMESDDSGKLLGYPLPGGEYMAYDGSIFEQVTLKSQTGYMPIASASAFASTADSVIATAIDRFKNIQTIGTRDPDESLDLQMKISPKRHAFTIDNQTPFPEQPVNAIQNLDFVEPLFFDEMLSNSINFQYLPPLTEELKLGSPPKPFGSYTKYHRPSPMTYTSIMRHLNISFDDDGNIVGNEGDPDEENDISSMDLIWTSRDHAYEYLVARGVDDERINEILDNVEFSDTFTVDQVARERVSVFFDSTSSTNNIMMQMFEVESKSSRLKKLDVIHYKEFNTPSDTRHPIKNVFFIGKIFLNSIGLPVFINLFTMVVD